MNLIDALLAEHGMLYLMFDQVEQTAAGGAESAASDGAASLVIKAVIAHAELEEELLFTALETRMGPAGPLAVMRAEHDEIHRRLEAGSGGPAETGALQRVLNTIPLAREHFAKEEQVLFQMARQVLSADELSQLSLRWASARNVPLP